MGTDEALLAAELGDVAAQIRPRLRVVELEPGQALVSHGQPSRTLYLVADGELAASRPTDGAVVQLGVVGFGAWVGEIGLIDGGPATATVTATTACRLLALDHEGLVALTEDEPEVAAAVLGRITRTLAQRLRRTSAGALQTLDGGDVQMAEAPQRRGWMARAMGWLAGAKEDA
jgi:CRP-like cAMP-binding protein